MILVVDDEDEIRALFMRYLGKKGYEVQSAANLTDGRELYKKIKPSLIFLDVNLPDGNGLEELCELKKANLSGKVIMMSAFVHQEDRVKAQGLGAIDFLSKPFSLSLLDQVIQSQLTHPSTP